MALLAMLPKRLPKRIPAIRRPSCEELGRGAGRDLYAYRDWSSGESQFELDFTLKWYFTWQ